MASWELASLGFTNQRRPRRANERFGWRWGRWIWRSHIPCRL
jgi:hypothetical protein